MFDVSYAECGEYKYEEVQKALRQALLEVTDFSWLKKGMTVALKVNLLTGKIPDKAVTTHPFIVCALCEILVEHGAKPIIGDSPGGVFTEGFVGRIYKTCGMESVVSYGGELNADFSQEEIKSKNGKILSKFDCTSWLLKADAVINLCKLKTHGMTTLTAGVKNMFGSVPGTKKPEYHFRYPNIDDFGNMLVDVYETVAPTLTICDAVLAMEGNGPNSGTPRKVGYIVAANNAHTLDIRMSKLINLNPDRVTTIRAAKSRNLVPENAKISNQPPAIRDYKIPETGGLLFTGHGKGVQKIRGSLMKLTLSSKPWLVPEKCVGCKECAEVCPADAIIMKDKKPKINRRKCILCFCCQEFCPFGALEVKRPLIAKMLNSGK